MRPTVISFIGVLVVGIGAQEPAYSQPESVPGEVIIKIRPSALKSRVEAMLVRNGCVREREVEDLDIMLVSFRDSATPEEMAQRLAADPDIEFAHPNYIGQGGFTPNDTHFGTQWHHDNTGQTAGTIGADIESIRGWDMSRGSSGIVVAVLDTGIDSDHPDFAGRIGTGSDIVNGDTDPEADHPHGTQVSGLAAANADNGFGVAGVDHFATIMPVKVLNQNNAGTTMDLIDGLNFAAMNGADIISMSLINYPGTAGLETALQNARNQGSILIACAGNGGIGNADVSFPGASIRTIAIGATDDDDVRAGFSGTGAALDLVAPGNLVRTVLQGSATDTFSNFSGCSAATPVAAGVASVALAVDNTLTHDEMRQILIDGAEDQVGNPVEDTVGRDDFYGWGRINLRRTLCRLDEMDPTTSCPLDIAPECAETGGSPATEAAIAGFLDGASVTDDLDSAPEIDHDAPAFFFVGTPRDVTFTGRDACAKESSCVARVTVMDSLAPDITCPADVAVECTGSLGIDASDPALAPFFSSVSSNDVCDAFPAIGNDAPAFFPLGDTAVTFTATDGSTNSSSCSATVAVADTTPPEITVNVDRQALWPPNHRMVSITADVQVIDECNPAPSFVLTSITSNEPDNGNGDGNHPNDIQGADFGTADVSFQLRAERSGRGSGRTYTIVYTASDGAGNSAEAVAVVNVPHSQGKK